MTDDLKLADGFEARNEEAWRAAIEKVLKGADFTERLVSYTADGIALQPLYMQDTKATIAAAAQAGAPWGVVQRVDHPDVAAANDQALDDLQNGASGLTLVPASSFTARGFGITDLSRADHLAGLLDGIALDMIALRIEPSIEAPGIATALAAYVKSANTPPSQTKITFGLAPIAHLMTTGVLPETTADTMVELRTTVTELKANGFSAPSIVCDARPVSEAGGSEAQELAVLIASAVAYLRGLEASGMALDQAVDTISFCVPIDAGQFEGLAKLRALRKLWASVQQAAGLDLKPAEIHAEAAWRMLTKRDAAVNMLRSTMAVFTAGVGGADSMSVLPHTLAQGLPDGFARRVARNTQNILIEESNLWRVADPAAGAGGVEALTDELCQAAWRLFQEIERDGGLFESLASGALQDRIATVAENRRRRLSSRRDPITGTSEFPQLDEPAGSILDIEPQPRVSITGGAVVVPALPSTRVAEPFEALRHSADAKTRADGGKRPAVFLANLGPLAEHTARATWTRNLLAVGGIDVLVPEGFTQSAEVGKAFAASGATAACICSNDENYAALGEAAAMALKGAGAETVYLAGKPVDQADLLRAAGVDSFLHVGIDVLEALRDLHTRLDIGAA